VLSRCLGTGTALRWDSNKGIVLLWCWVAEWPLCFYSIVTPKDPAPRDVHESTNTFLGSRLSFIHRLIHDPRIRATALYCACLQGSSTRLIITLHSGRATLAYSTVSTTHGVGRWAVRLTLPPRVLPFWACPFYLWYATVPSIS